MRKLFHIAVSCSEVLLRHVRDGVLAAGHLDEHVIEWLACPVLELVDPYLVAPFSTLAAFPVEAADEAAVPFVLVHDLART